MTKRVRIKDLYIGGGAPITVQSMTTTPTHDVEATLCEMSALRDAGCDIVRVTVPDKRSAHAMRAIVDGAGMPVVADVHFDYKLAVSSIESGVHKIRFNPGNIGDDTRVKYLVDCAKSHSVPIRIGVNGGSLRADIRERYGVTAEGLVESAMEHVRLLERFGFYDTVISVKSSSPLTTVKAYRRLAEICDYPLHLGVTEAGVGEDAIYKSVSALGSLLLDGIGDTIRISVTGSPVREVEAARKLLRAVGIDRDYVEIVSCPTCGRCMVDLERIATEVRERLNDVRRPLKVAVMGCIVNGPGEAMDADYGVAGGKDQSLLFVKGKEYKRIPNDRIVDELTALVRGSNG